MRGFVLALAAFMLPSSAFAADYMRGPMYEGPVAPRVHDWSGTYVGGHGGFSQQRLRTNDASLTDSLGLNQALIFSHGVGSGSTASYGGFIGFNAQWEDVVLGFEFNYSRMHEGVTSSRSFSTSYIFDQNIGPVPATATGTASQHITDLFGGRFRAGWSTGWIMPYATVGVVVGRGESFRTGVVVENADPTNFRGGSLSSLSATPFGFSAGLGVDMAITSNIFARAEIEYVGLRESKGIAGQFTTARAGVGYKF